MTITPGPTPPCFQLRVYPSSSGNELVGWRARGCQSCSHDYASAAQHAGVFFLLAGAVMLLVMLVISFCMTNMTDKLQFAFWFELAAGARNQHFVSHVV